MVEKLLDLDCETGGFNPKTDALCSVSISLEDGRKEKTWFIKPYNKNYNQEALIVNGLTIDFLNEKGVTLQTFITQFISYLESNFKHSKDIHLLGHNINFDIGFIKEAFNDCGLKYKDYFHYHYYDTMQTALMLKRFGLIPDYVKVNLIGLYIYFFGRDELVENAHNSLNDLRMTRKIDFKMGEIVTTKKII